MASNWLSKAFTGIQKSGGASGGVPTSLDPSNQTVGSYTKYGFKSAEEGDTGSVNVLSYSKVGNYLDNLNASNYSAALKAAGEGDSTQLKSLFKKLSA